MDAQDKFAWTERFGHIVVGAYLQTLNALARFASCRQHQNRQSLSLRVLLSSLQTE